MLYLEENISLPLILDKKDQSEIENSLNDLMKYFNILDLKKKYPYNISGGQRQRVAAARV